MFFCEIEFRNKFSNIFIIINCFVCYFFFPEKGVNRRKYDNNNIMIIVDY